jgi:hypothetical protein
MLLGPLVLTDLNQSYCPGAETLVQAPKAGSDRKTETVFH